MIASAFHFKVIFLSPNHLILHKSMENRLGLAGFVSILYPTGPTPRKAEMAHSDPCKIIPKQNNLATIFSPK